MSDKFVTKATPAEIANHWVLAGSCILLIITGYGFLFKIEGMYALFGSNTTMKLVHNWTGIVFTISLFAIMVEYASQALDLSMDDWNWIKVGGGYLSKKAVALPPMGKINTGQKLYYFMVVVAGLGISASGFAIWFVPGSQLLTQASHFVHNACFILFVVGVPAHAYLGTIANPGTFRIMVYGTVPIEFAKKKYPKWMKELGM